MGLRPRRDVRLKTSRRIGCALAAVAAVAAALVPPAAATEAGALAGSAAASGDGAPQADPRGIVPEAVPAYDRSAVGAEITAAMDMTPPDHDVRLDLPSGSQLAVRLSGFLVGAGGPDCRRIAYRYASGIDGASVAASGERCRQPDGQWTATNPDRIGSPVAAGSTPVSAADAATAEHPAARSIVSAAPTAAAGESPERTGTSARVVLRFPVRSRVAATPDGQPRDEDYRKDATVIALLRQLRYLAADESVADASAVQRAVGDFVNDERLRIPLTRTWLLKSLQTAIARTRDLGGCAPGAGFDLCLRAEEREALP